MYNDDVTDLAKELAMLVAQHPEAADPLRAFLGDLGRRNPAASADLELMREAAVHRQTLAPEQLHTDSGRALWSAMA
ncbi:MAG: hypothetical protein ACYC5O_00530 [Anaerolineae bacterium]